MLTRNAVRRLLIAVPRAAGVRTTITPQLPATGSDSRFLRFRRFNSTTTTAPAGDEIPLKEEAEEKINEQAEGEKENGDFDAIAIEEEMANIRRLFKSRSVVEADSKVELSPEMQAKLDNEFNSFMKEFILETDFLEEYLPSVDVDTKATDVKSILSIESRNGTSTTNEIDSSSGNIKGQIKFPNVLSSEMDEPYTSQELFLRRLFHAGSVSGVGSVITDVYEPHKDIFAPPTIRRTSIATLMAAGAHLGHSTSMLRQNNQQFVYGIRDDIHIIDLDQTLTYLRRAAKVAEGISEKGGVILYVGTMEGQERSLQVAAKRSSGYYVHSRWIPGTLTNSSQISGAWERIEVDMSDLPTGRKLSPGLLKTIVKPDLVVILNPVENRNLIHECIATRIPTIGIIDTDSEPSLVTYPIPANDDSLRTTDLIVGILSKSAQRGRSKRVSQYKSYQTEAERAEKSNSFNEYGDEAQSQQDAVTEEDLAALASRERKSKKRASKSGLA